MSLAYENGKVRIVVLKLWHLTVIREVIKTGSITRAASALGRSQPALSLVIADAENLIGYKLFQRNNGRLHPVPEARFFLERAEEILEKMNNLERFMKRDLEHSFQIRIACMPVLSEIFMPKQIACFSAKHPEAEFFLRAQPSNRVQESIASQQIDLGFAEKPEKSDLYSAKNFELMTVVALSREHPLSHHDVLTPKDLDGVPFTTHLPDHHLTKSLQAAFDNNGSQLKVPYYLQNAASQYTIVESGQAVGFMSLISVWIYRQLRNDVMDQRIVFRPFLPKIHQTISLITPAHRPISQICQQFLIDFEDAIDDVIATTKQEFQYFNFDT